MGDLNELSERLSELHKRREDQKTCLELDSKQMKIAIWVGIISAVVLTIGLLNYGSPVGLLWMPGAFFLAGAIGVYFKHKRDFTNFTTSLAVTDAQIEMVRNEQTKLRKKEDPYGLGNF